MESMVTVINRRLSEHIMKVEAIKREILVASTLGEEKELKLEQMKLSARISELAYLKEMYLEEEITLLN